METKSNYLEAKNMAFTNFYTLSGIGRGIVVSLQNEIDNSRENSRIRKSRIIKGLDRLALILSSLSLIASVVYLIAYFAWLRPILDYSFKHIAAHTVGVSSSVIPVGLPVTLTLGLFIAYRKLSRHDIIIKNIYSIYSMADVNVVLTDKTGTLTQNSLEVTDVIYSTCEIDVDLCEQTPDVYLGGDRALGDLLDLCEFATVDPFNSTEKALFEFSRKNKPGSRPLSEFYDVIDEIKFNSNSKYQVKIVRTFEQDLSNEKKTEKYFLWVRGAHDIMFTKSKSIVKPDGRGVFTEQKYFDNLESKIVEWCFKGRRIICLCRKLLHRDDIEKIKQMNDLNKWFSQECNDLVVMGIIGLMDPLRPWYSF